MRDFYKNDEGGNSHIRDPAEMTHEELVQVVRSVQGILWLGDLGDEQGTEGIIKEGALAGACAIDAIYGVLAEYDLNPVHGTER